MQTVEETPPPLLPRRFVPVFLAVTGLLFFYIVTDRNGRLWAPQDMGAFYDHLAVSMGEGRLDVPPEAIGPEAFIIEGKYYGYWAPFPAILRMPLIVLPEDWWVGKTARTYNWLGAMLSAVWLIGILRELSKVLGLPSSRPGFLALFVVASVWGSHIPYLLAGPSVYHEAVLWAGTLTVGALYAGLIFINRKQPGWLIAAALCATAAALTRATPGYGALIGVGLLAGISWLKTYRNASEDGAQRSKLNIAIGLVVMGSLLPFAYNTVRFGSATRLPYDKHTSVAEWRLEITRDGSFQAVNFVPNAVAYFDPTQIGFRAGFPHFHLRAFRERAGARLEHAEAHAGIAAFMTGLCLLAVIGGVLVVTRIELLPLLAGGLATVGALFSFTALAHRYAHDLVGLGLLLSTAGALWIAGQQNRPAQFGRIAIAILLVLGIWQSLSFAHYELEWLKKWLESKP